MYIPKNHIPKGCDCKYCKGTVESPTEKKLSLLLKVRIEK